MLKNLENSLREIVSQLAGEEFVDKVLLEQTKDAGHGDFTTNIAMQLAKPLSKNPRELAQEIVDKLIQNSKLKTQNFQVAGPGFINFSLSEDSLVEFLQGVLTKTGNFGQGDGLKGQQYFVEFAHPNTHKAFHIGHLRNICLGESLVRIFESQGASVFRANYQGDIGPHVAKCLWGIQQEGLPENLTDVKKRAEYLGQVYAVGGTAYESDEHAKVEITEINKAIYDGEDKSLLELYHATRQWSLDYFETVYDRLGTHFDRLFFESEVWQSGMQIVKDNLGEVFEESQGAIVFLGEKYGLHTRVFITKHQTATYEAKEIGLSFKELEACSKMDKKVHIVANEQSGYFEVVFKAIEMLNPDLIDKQKHVDYGMVKLSSGKMSSRTGDVITADWLIDTAKEEIADIMNKADFNEAEFENIKEKVAIGAIKFMMLAAHSKNDIAFDLSQAVRLDGDSGPYLQYAYARIQSILRKTDYHSDTSPESINFENCNGKDFDLIRKMLHFEEAVARAASSFSPHYIAHYLLDLASEFSSWYSANRVVDEAEDLKLARLAILQATAQTIKNGLNLLGIEVLEKM